MICLKEHGRCAGSFDETTDLNELPAFAMAHGRVCNFLKLMNYFHHHLEKFRQFYPVFNFGSGYVQIERVEPVPLFCRYLFANMTRVLTRGDDATNYRRFDRGIERERSRKRICVVCPHDIARTTQRAQYPKPSMFGACRAFVEHEAEVHVEQACRMFS